MSAHQDTDTEAVYVRLLDEGTDVWRPVHATALPDGTVRLLEPHGYDPRPKQSVLHDSEVRAAARAL
jgi:hypothetical protein